MNCGLKGVRCDVCPNVLDIMGDLVNAKLTQELEG